MQQDQKNINNSGITIFLCGDVMTGRGIDQILPYSVDARLYESYVKDAREYVRLAERKNGSIAQPVSYRYIWNDALEVWKAMSPDFRLINLETSITTHEVPWLDKAVNYRMHPGNIEIFRASETDYCALANNHILDWGVEGLQETIRTLNSANIQHSGAGNNAREALEPAILKKDDKRILVFSYGSETSGVPHSWSAGPHQAGINMLPGMSSYAFGKLSSSIKNFTRENDIVIFSVHWGGNWGYRIPVLQREFAHRLIEEAGVDIVHGHSSHHPKGIEIYKSRLILYGAGDFINDYEGIGGYEQYRDDLTLMYFPEIDPGSGALISCRLFPMQIRNMQLNHPGKDDVNPMLDMLNREGEELGTSFRLNEDGSLSMNW